ncbi:unnamed protein product [Euphydryas editha]|uniref:Acyltransferase 3 domain-containing protein n=1 Tax=Euphydryas editha TaxID=104508 RepID=A0AAU9TNL3_EUPED|nr:unnamed protein product [Euphydryas editha]
MSRERAKYLVDLTKKEKYSLSSFDKNGKIPLHTVGRATEFERMPPVYKTDNYESCLQEPSDVFCELFFQLVSDEPNELLYMIEEYSEYSTTHFDHTKLRHGVCVTQRCQNYIENNTSISETILERCLNQTFWDDYRLKTRIQKYSCHNLASREIHIDNSDIAAGFIVLTILVLNVVGSLYDVYCTSLKRKGNPIILSFSIKRHWRNLITTSHNDGQSNNIKGFNGLRCIIAYGVIFVHTTITYYIIGGSIHEIETSYKSLLYQLMINGPILMQAFFVLAGFHLAYKLRIISEEYQLDWSIFPKAIFKRYLRLVPAYAFVLLMVATWFRLQGRGPFWEVVGEVNISNCKKSWWMSLIFINNYVNGPHCLVVSWSIAADMQLYLFGIILIILLKNTKFRQTILMSLVMLGSVIVAIHTYVRDLDAVVIYRPTVAAKIFETDPTFNETYRMGHGNMSSYLTGMSLGYFIYEWQKKKIDIRKYSKLRILYWLVIPMIVALVLSAAFFYRDGPRYPRHIRAICAAFIKTASGGLIAIFVAGLVMKLENVYRKVLEWDIWVIPSRLTYSIYLVHYPFLIVYMNMQNSLVHMSYLHMIATSVVITITSFIFSIPLYLLVEAPFSSILNTLQLKKTVIKQNDSNGCKKTK